MNTKMRLSAIVLAGGLLALSAAAMAQQDNTEHTAHLTAADGTQVVLTSGQPAAKSYGPAPAFDQLDANHDGSISRQEAEAYVPLFNDFDHLAHHSERISKAQFERWNQNENRP